MLIRLIMRHIGFKTLILAVCCISFPFLLNSDYGRRQLMKLHDQLLSEQQQQELSNLVAESQRAVDLNPVEITCPMYQEFRRLDFQHPAVKKQLCQSAEAYEKFMGSYPMCLLPDPFNQDMLNVIRHGSESTALTGVHGLDIPIVVYKDSEFISNVIRQYSNWEPQLAQWTLGFALKLPDVTFLDIGSNIGVYSLQAAKLGLRVVALDANIRNLLRLRLSLQASSLDATLVWNFISPDQSLKYLSFLANCNVGGAGRDEADLPDTVPVMPVRSERIASLISTKNVVMKMDIQGGEADFLLTSGSLFTDFKVAAVQMEWYPPMIRGNDSAVLTEFFIHRGYKLWRFPDFYPLQLKKIGTWGPIDIIWIHKDFLNLL